MSAVKKQRRETLLNPQQLAYLKAMGIQAWLPREAEQAVTEVEHSAAEQVVPQAMQQPDLQQRVQERAVLMAAPAAVVSRGQDDELTQAVHVTRAQVQHDDWQALQSRFRPGS